jgi:predicted CXXCH cytochrome family protein
MAKGKRKRKGVFSDLRLPVASEYVYPAPRHRLLLIGGLSAVVIAALIGIDIAVGDSESVSNGPLSASHALLQTDCASCHTPFETVTDTKCATCHEKFGDDLGVYTFASHYVYRSQDFTRVVSSPEEVACYSCHEEHQGRDAALTEVPDAMCASCHEFGSFTEGHPEFDFAAENVPDPANLKFGHTRHVAEVMERADLADLEQSCLYCHEAEAEGLGFQPMSFENACSTCHIAAGTTTEWLDLEGPGPETPGVRTLETIRAGRAPGTRWSDYMNPAEFQVRGDQVRKTRIYHEDPWILDNLKRLQTLLYPGSELAALLRTSGDVPDDEAGRLYAEALATLRNYVKELRSEPGRDVQRALTEIDELIALAEKQLRDPLTPLDETRFLVSHISLNADFDPITVAAYESLIESLTGTCQTCHAVERAALARVQTDQRILTRADFNHRAHITQRGCLDCHSDIPIREFAARDSVASVAVDHAEIQNIPRIETCRTCHAPSRAPVTCVTCHVFHADKSQHFNLLRYLD